MKINKGMIKLAMYGIAGLAIYLWYKKLIPTKEAIANLAINIVIIVLGLVMLISLLIALANGEFSNKA